MNFYKKLGVKGFTLIPLLTFVLFLLLIKTGLFGGTKIENPAYAAAMSVSQIEPSAGHNVSMMNRFKGWNEARLIKARIHSDERVIYSLRDDELRKVFGVPSLERKDGLARMVQYVTASCVADFYYQEGSDHKIRYFELRPVDAAMNDSSACMRQLLN